MNKIENISNETNLVPIHGLVVIADDITGAAEIAGVCLRYGLKVSFGIDTIPDEIADVCIVATDSRSLSELEACTIHSKLAIDVYRIKPALVFKKCDSVLRGYVLSELSALLAESHQKKILLVPANPLSGRCIINGFYYVGDHKIENTGFSTDPDFPATDSSVQNILLQRSKKHDNINDVHTGKITKLRGSGVFIPDCNSVNDLQQSCLLASENTLLCGSAAFFEQVLISRGFTKSENEQPKFSKINKFLLVAGTIHPETKLFEERLRRNNCTIEKFPTQFLSEMFDENEFSKWIISLQNNWNENKMLSIGISDKPVIFTNSNVELKTRLSKVVAQLLINCTISEMFIEGGATTYSILKTLSLASLTPEIELASGVLRLKVNDADNLWITIKPGSYPWPEKIIEK